MSMEERCDHGRAVGWCPFCPLVKEIEELKAENEELRATIEKIRAGFARIRGRLQQ
tara:strand:+ start:164 stop:331 length:168 start_codon:yes stop_codon:yes gene_type:complete